MKVVSTANAFLDRTADWEAETWGVMDSQELAQRRAEHVVFYVIPERTRVLPTTLYAGEAEALILDPLVKIANDVLTSNRKEGIVTDTLMDYARYYGIVAEVLNAAGNKLVLDEYGALLAEQSPLSAFPGAPPIKDKQGNIVAATARDNVAHRLSALLRAPIKEVVTAGRFIPGASAANLSAKPDPNEISDKILRYAGIGRGVPLFYSQYTMQMEKLTTIEWACRSLVDPTVHPYYDGSEDVTPLPTDAYALSIAYLAYLHIISSPTVYDSKFPPQLAAIPTQMRIPMQQSACRAVAWHFSSVAVASQMVDAHSALGFIKSAFSFLQPTIDSDLLAVKEATDLLATAESRINELVSAPVLNHANMISQWFRTLYGVDVLLPSLFTELLPSTSIGLDPLVAAGAFAPNKDNAKTSWLSAETASMFINRYQTVARDLRYYVDSVGVQLKQYFSSMEPTRIDAFGLPADLLSADLVVYPGEKPVYTSPFAREFVPLSIPQYLYTKQGKAAWSLAPYRNAIVSLTSLKKSLTQFASRYVYDVKVTMPAAATMPERFSRTLIPHFYVRHGWFQAITNTASAIYDFLAQNKDFRRMSPNPFEDVALALLSNPLYDSGIIDSLAGMFRIWRKNPGDKVFTELEPQLPTLYGVPTGAFLKKQPRPSDLSKVPTDPTQASTAIRVVISRALLGDAPATLVERIIPGSRHTEKTVTLPQGAKGQAVSYEFVFSLHSFVPEPAPLISVPHVIQPGCMINVPLSVDLLAGSLESLRAGFAKSTNPSTTEKSAKLLTSIRSAIANESLKTDVIEWRPVNAWSTLYALFPHVFFSYQAAPTEGSQLVDLVATKVRRSKARVGQYMLTEARIDTSLVVIEETDFLDFIPLHDLPTFTPTTLEGQSVGSTPTIQSSGHEQKFASLEGQSVVQQEVLAPIPDHTTGGDLTAAALNVTAQASPMTKASSQGPPASPTADPETKESVRKEAMKKSHESVVGDIPAQSGESAPEGESDQSDVVGTLTLPSGDVIEVRRKKGESPEQAMERAKKEHGIDG